jgi:hypothetical protein
MARIWTSNGAEGGDVYEWDVPNTVQASTNQARTGAYSYRCIGFTPSAPWKDLGSEYGELFLRAPIWCGSNGDFEGAIEYYDGSDNLIGSLELHIAGPSSQMRVKVGTSVVATASMPWYPGEWHVIEMRLHINASGHITVKFDGTQKINYSGNTTNGHTGVQQLVPRCMDRNLGSYIDDWAVNDTSGGVDDTWLGDGGINALTPNGAGNYADLIASAGTPYQCVDDVPHNSDTDYVYESTADKKSTYAMSNLPTLPLNSSISRVIVRMVARESAAAGDKIATLLRSGSTDDQGADQSLTISYFAYQSQEYLTDPADDAAWTSTKVNALEAGAVVR